jgi:salicylate hydroxylase
MGSRLMGEYVYHPAGAKAAVRNAALRAKTASQFHDEFAWLYGADPVAGLRDPEPSSQ